MSAGMSESSSSAERGIVTISGCGVASVSVLGGEVGWSCGVLLVVLEARLAGSVNSERVVARALREVWRRDFWERA